MELSPPLSCSQALVAWSGDGQFLAHAVKSRLVVREAGSLTTLASQVVEDDVDGLHWAPDSEFVAVSVAHLGLVHVFSPFNPDWSARISQGSVGLSRVLFAPDSRHILVLAQFQITLTVWSLTHRKVKFVEHPKHFAFAPDAQKLAVVEKSAGGESLAFYRTSDWQLSQRVTPNLSDIANLAWSPLGDVLVLWAQPLQCAFQVVCAQGLTRFTFQRDSLELGIQMAQFSRCGQLLYVATHDAKIRVFNTLNWTVVDELEPQSPILSHNVSSLNCTVFEEVDRPLSRHVDGQVVQELLNARETQFNVVKRRPVLLSEIAVDPRKPNPRIGIASLVQSPDGAYLAVRTRSMPAVIWVWSIQDLELMSVIVTQSSVQSMAWECSSQRLLVATAQTLLIWTPFGAVKVKVPIPDELQASSVAWNPRGRTFSLAGKSHFICGKIEHDSRLKPGSQ